MAALCVPVPAFIAGFQIVGRQHARQLFQLPAFPRHVRTAQLPNDTPAVSQCEFDFQEREPARQLNDLRLVLVHLNAERRNLFPDQLRAFSQVLFVRVDDIPVIHIPTVAFAAHALFYHVVEPVRYGYGECLRYLRTKPQAFHAEHPHEVF